AGRIRLAQNRWYIQISLAGFPPEEIEISLKAMNIRAYNLTFDDISRAVRMNNMDVTAGSIRTDDEKLLIRLKSKEYFAENIRNIVVKTDPSGMIVRLEDVAEVKNTWDESPQRTYLNGQKSVVVNVDKLIGQNIINIADKVESYIDEFNSKHETVQAKVLNDTTVNLSERLNMLISNGSIGALLVLMSLALFINIRLGFWVALGLPLSFLGMFLLAYINGITINAITLFGCIVVVGILVDDGIVIAESIYQRYESGEKPFNAALGGTLEILKSVVFALATTITAFMPFFFFDGRQGANMQDMAFVVIFTLLFSLLEAALILPSHLAHSKAIRAGKEKSNFRKKLDKMLSWPRDNIFNKILRYFLSHKSIAVAIAIAITLITFGAFQGGIIGATFFPFLDDNVIEVNLTMTPGTRAHETRAVLEKIEKAAIELNEELKEERADNKDVIQKTVINIARGPIGLFGAVTEARSHNGSLQLYLLSGEQRDMQSFKIVNRLREKVGEVYEAEEIVWGGASGFGKPISISLISPEIDDLEAAKTQLQQGLGNMSELRDISDNDPEGLREVNMKLNERAYLLGLNAGTVAMQVRQGFFGEEIQRLQRSEDEIKVWVRLPDTDRASLKEFENFRIMTAQGGEYPLGQLIDYEIERGSIVINHINGMREITVDADLVDQNAEVPPILDEIEENILNPILDKYPTVSTVESGQQREIKKFARSAQMTMPIAFVVMFLLLTLSFRSFFQALLVFSLIPLGLIGAVWGHFVHGMPVNLMSVYGLLALFGVIVNDSIVFVNTFNDKMRRGAKIMDAVYETGLNRFRPIFLTTLTTVLGLAPLIAETSFQAQFLIPMAISLAYGLLFSTMLILVFLPVLILLANKLRIWAKWLLTGSKPEPEEVEPAVKEKTEIERYFGGEAAK
ncbi:MAG: efflux RND transporter permease subunit, partial [Bacteroidota bacterium]